MAEPSTTSNPFRRRVPASSKSAGQEPAIDPAAFSPNPPNSSAGLTSPRAERSPSKRVRIVSPAGNTLQLEDESPAESPFAAALPPGAPTSSFLDANAAAADPFGSGSEDEASSSDVDSAAEAPQVVADVPPKAASTASPNPFRYAGALLSSPAGGPRSSPGREGKKKGGRASLDVDAFKRLILTGNVDASSASVSHPSLHPPPAVHGDGGSVTDTSSISRQSLFESASGPVMDTPRTSHDSALTVDEETDGGPAAAAESWHARSQTPKAHSAATPPRSPVTKQMMDPLGDRAPAGSLESAIPAKKTVPEPPLSRRHSQHTPSKTPVRPGSSRSERFELTAVDEKEKENRRPGGESRAVPPPPPLRRGSQRRTQSPSIAGFSMTAMTSTTPSSPSPSLSTSTSYQSSTLPTPPPPPPSRRRSSSSVKRSSLKSVLSLDDRQALSSITDSAASSAMAPPPPPPRRHRGSSRGSGSHVETGAYPAEADARASSHQSSTLSVSEALSPSQLERQTSSPSSLPLHSKPPSGLATKSGALGEVGGEIAEGGRGGGGVDAGPQRPEDVLADLTALREEVDALRGKLSR